VARISFDQLHTSYKLNSIYNAPVTRTFQ